MFYLGNSAIEYEPYTTNTLSLPISTHFPTGMKDCSQTVYDEMNLTIGKGHERVGSVDLGSLNWEYGSDRFITSNNSSGIIGTTSTSILLCSNYGFYNATTDWNNQTDKTIANAKYLGFTSVEGRLLVYDSSYTDATQFKQMLIDTGAKLYFELATPTEFDISLDLTYPIWSGGTEQILPMTVRLILHRSRQISLIQTERKIPNFFISRLRLYSFLELGRLSVRTSHRH